MTRLNPALRAVYRAPIHLYRWRLGSLAGHRFVLLRHVGRRSGLRRETVLEVAEYRADGPEIVVISAYGRDADWLRNIAATRQAEIVLGGRSFAAAHRLLDSDEAIAVVAGYERRNRLMAPLIRAVLSRFLGWPYRGSESDRRRLVAQLPLVAFRPAS